MARDFLVVCVWELIYIEVVREREREYSTVSPYARVLYLTDQSRLIDEFLIRRDRGELFGGARSNDRGSGRFVTLWRHREATRISGCRWVALWRHREAFWSDVYVQKRKPLSEEWENTGHKVSVQYRTLVSLCSMFFPSCGRFCALLYVRRLTQVESNMRNVRLLWIFSWYSRCQWHTKILYQPSLGIGLTRSKLIWILSRKRNFWTLLYSGRERASYITLKRFSAMSQNNLSVRICCISLWQHKNVPSVRFSATPQSWARLSLHDQLIWTQWKQFATDSAGRRIAQLEASFSSRFTKRSLKGVQKILYFF